MSLVPDIRPTARTSQGPARLALEAVADQVFDRQV
jgi:hypothetical protein